MRKVGIDLSDAKPQKLTEDLPRDAQLLITIWAAVTGARMFPACGARTGPPEIREAGHRGGPGKYGVGSRAVSAGSGYALCGHAASGGSSRRAAERSLVSSLLLY
jgi:hypothetical protein